MQNYTCKVTGQLLWILILINHTEHINKVYKALSAVSQRVSIAASISLTGSGPYYTLCALSTFSTNFTWLCKSRLLNGLQRSTVLLGLKVSELFKVEKLCLNSTTLDRKRKRAVLACFTVCYDRISDSDSPRMNERTNHDDFVGSLTWPRNWIIPLFDAHTTCDL